MTPRQAIVPIILLGLLAFELVALVTLAAFPYLPDPGVVWLNNAVYVLLQPLTTVLALGLLYAWLVKILVKQAARRSLRFRSFTHFMLEAFQNLLITPRTTSLSDAARSIRLLSHPRILLTTSLVISALVPFVPYRPALNPTSSLVGVDTPFYMTWTSQMLSLPWPQAIQYAFVQGLDGSRPLLLILLYLVASTGVSLSTVIEYLSVLLAPLLTLSIYTFVRYGQGSARLAGLASLFSAVSFYTTVGLWGGYYANWLALTFAFVFATLLLGFTRTPTVSRLAGMLVCSTALFLTHPWTWVLFATVSLLFALTIWRETHKFVYVQSMIGIIMAGVILDVAKSLIFTTPTVAADIATKTPNSSVLFGFWNNLVQAVLYTHSGLMADWLVLGLGTLAVLVLRFKDGFERLLLLWAAIPSIPFIALDSYNQARILYDLPTPILTTIATIYIAKLILTKPNRWQEVIILLLLVATAGYTLQGVLLVRP